MTCLVWNFKVPSRMKVSIEKEPLRKLERNTQSWNVAALFDFKCRLNINFCKKKKKFFFLLEEAFFFSLSYADRLLTGLSH